MKCPYCGHIDLKVVESRDSDTGESIRRRRECLQCSKRFTTYERIEAVPLYVMKKDGRREDFDRQKLFSGLMKATAKREISPSTVERVVDEIEAELLSSDRGEDRAALLAARGQAQSERQGTHAHSRDPQEARLTSPSLRRRRTRPRGAPDRGG